MSMTIGYRQTIKESLLRFDRFDYPLPNNAHVYLNVSDKSGQWWARWTLEIRENDGEVYERTRRRRFNKKEDAANWLYQDFDAPWTDTGPTLHITGPVPRPGDA